MSTRDPLLDPQVGDVIYKISESTGRKFTRTVLERVENNVTYADHNGRKINCWLSVWMDWSLMADVETVSEQKSI